MMLINLDHAPVFATLAVGAEWVPEGGWRQGQHLHEELCPLYEARAFLYQWARNPSQVENIGQLDHHLTLLGSLRAALVELQVLEEREAMRSTFLVGDLVEIKAEAGRGPIYKVEGVDKAIREIRKLDNWDGGIYRINFQSLVPAK